MDVRAYRNRGLTESEESLIVSMYKDGEPIKDIVSKVSVAVSTVNNVVERNGVKKRGYCKYPRKTRVEALRLAKNGLSSREIGERLGVPKRTVNQWRCDELERKRNIVKPKKTTSEQERKRNILSLWKPTSEIQAL